MSARLNVVALVMAVGLMACKSTPDYVIAPDDMASLLADMYTAESIVEINRTTFMTDSMKKVMKQSVYARHGVTAEQVDTSFVWYGHHIEDYIKVHDRVVEILEKNIAEASATNAAFGVEGDSVDTWQWSRHYELTRISPSQVVTFNLPKDDNWEKGDIYLWSMKFINNRSILRWGISAEYADGRIEYCNSEINGEGWNKLQYISDSTQVPVRIAGYLMRVADKGENLYIDSVSLIRDRVKPGLYHQRYRQRSIGIPNRDFEAGSSHAEEDSITERPRLNPIGRRDHRRPQ